MRRTHPLLRRFSVSGRFLCCALSLLVPLSVLFVLWLAGINTQIDFASKEKLGNEYQRPLEDLLRLLPEWGAARTDASAVDKAFQALEAVDRRCGAALEFTPEGLGKRQRGQLLPSAFRARWEAAKALPPERRPTAALVADVRGSITHAGDTSNLILDPDLDSYYLMDATLLGLPELQTLLATAMDDATQPPPQGKSAQDNQLHLAVLAAQIQAAASRVTASVATAINEDPNFNGVSPNLASLAAAANGCEQAAAAFAAKLTTAPRQNVLADGGRARQASFELWGAAAGELDTLLDKRIKIFKDGMRRGCLMTALALLFAGTLFVAIARSITTPVREIVGVIKRMGEGDLEAMASNVGSDELSEISKNLNHLGRNLAEAKRQIEGNVSRLEQVLVEVAEVADQMATGSGKLSSSSEEFSQGATEQVAALEEISSSLTQINGQTQLNAGNAIQAKELVAAVCEAAGGGAGQMAGMLRAMEDIQNSSDKIDKIIKVIDDIAFQTNILALNASVEAARVGQHGRGFAVVAAEVRNLAVRAAAAAQETEALIAGASNEIRHGAAMANQAADTFQNIASGVAKANELVGEIAAASNEQAMGISQINQGVEQIEGVARQNSSSSEETASASKQLATQADALRRIACG